MFGFLKKKSKSADNFLRFCERADDALMLCYEQRDVHAVIPYFATPLLHAIHEELLSGDDMLQEYGIAKYRNRTWDGKRTVDDTHFSIIKRIRHENVYIRGMVSIPVGDDIDEEWIVEQNGAEWRVCEMRRI